MDERCRFWLTSGAIGGSKGYVHATSKGPLP